MRRPSRSMIAAVLTLLAIAVPSAAWYVAGGSAARNEAEQLESNAVDQAQRVADGLARRLALRLDVLIRQEAQRPATHYVANFADPSSDCGCAMVSSSPLARGHTDPLVWSYFQVSPDRWISVPGLAAADHLDVCEAETATPTTLDAASFEEHTERRDLLQRDVGSLVKNMSIRVRTFAGWTDIDSLPPGYAAPVLVGPDAVLTIGPYHWRTLPRPQLSALAAVRRVTTTVGDFVQGFVVSEEQLTRDLSDALYPARMTSAPDSVAHGRVWAPVQLAGVQRWVEVDATEALAQASLEGDRALGRFRRGFVGITLAALLAGLSVIGLVAQSERLARQRAQFAAAAAHELRTPLAGLRVYADMLGENLGHAEQRERYARQLTHETERLGRVVSNMLGYARLERGAIDINPAPGDIGHLARDVADRLRPAIEKNGASVAVSVEDDLPEVSLDEDAMFRVLQNLIDNAEKHTRDADDRRIDVAVGRAADGGVVVEVRDRGPGVPEARRARLFRPFQRGEDGSPTPGLGLGLPLAKGIVERHRGRLTVHDAPEGGASFRVWLPASGA